MRNSRPKEKEKRAEKAPDPKRERSSGSVAKGINSTASKPRPEYRLDRDESFASGCRRVAAEELELTAKAVRRCAARNDPTSVHQARKHLKRLRTLLELIRPAIGEEVFLREKSRIRRIARTFTAPRDVHVCVKTVESLKSSTTEAMFKEVHAIFMALARQSPPVAATKLEAIFSSLKEASAGVAEWRFPPSEESLLKEGVKRIFRRARKAHSAAGNEPSDERLHRSRRRTKDLWQALHLFRCHGKKEMRERARAAQRLAELLGDDHDLAVLGAALQDAGQPHIEPATITALQESIAGRRAELQRRAWKLGEWLFAKKPRKLARRILHGTAK